MRIFTTDGIFHLCKRSCQAVSMHGNTARWSVGLWMILSLAAGHLTEEQKSIIVDMHNDLRSQVQPTAAFMQKVVWDETLRVVAEGYAAKCNWDRNPEAVELLGKTSLFEERLDYDFESNSCSEDKMCGHYTQMVWADSRRIGCATHLCETLEGLDVGKVTLLICNYLPQGNSEGKRAYEAGRSCSKCPEDLPVCEQNFCVADNIFPSEEPKSPESSEDHRRTEETGRESDVMRSRSEEQKTSSALLLVAWISAVLILR